MKQWFQFSMHILHWTSGGVTAWQLRHGQNSNYTDRWKENCHILVIDYFRFLLIHWAWNLIYSPANWQLKAPMAPGYRFGSTEKYTGIWIMFSQIKNRLQSLNQLVWAPIRPTKNNLGQTLTLVTKLFQRFPCFSHETAPDKVSLCCLIHENAC